MSRSTNDITTTEKVPLYGTISQNGNLFIVCYNYYRDEKKNLITGDADIAYEPKVFIETLKKSEIDFPIIDWTTASADQAAEFNREYKAPIYDQISLKKYLHIIEYHTDAKILNISEALLNHQKLNIAL